MDKKKYIIAGLFLVGGTYFIKKLLPNLRNRSKSLQIDSTSSDDVFDKLYQEREQFKEEKREELQNTDFSKYGAYSNYARNSIFEASLKGFDNNQY